MENKNGENLENFQWRENLSLTFVRHLSNPLNHFHWVIGRSQKRIVFKIYAWLHVFTALTTILPSTFGFLI